VRNTLVPGMTNFRIDFPEEKYLGVRVSPLFYKERDFQALWRSFMTLRRSRSLNRSEGFVANVSHELKTPLRHQGFC